MKFINMDRLPLRGLKGRGQLGLAAFYAFNERIYLIKADTPGICFAESMVFQYNHPLHNKDLEPPILQAEACFARLNLRDSVMVSMQPEFIPSMKGEICGLDELVFGRKRNPKTLYSEESSHSDSIKKAIAMMTPEAKKQLAYAIYTSQLNGDESLHTGQFMIEKSIDKKQIIKIQRIDFGALGRYAEQRTDFDPFHTSKAYASSGQFRKDYVSFLLQDREVTNHLLELWANTEVSEVMISANKQFATLINNIKPSNVLEEAQSGVIREAVNTFYNELSKGVAACEKIEEKKSLESAIELLKSKFLSTVKTRCDQMKIAALKERKCADKFQQIINLVHSVDAKMHCRTLAIFVNTLIKKEGLKPSEQIALIENEIKPSRSEPNALIYYIRSILNEEVKELRVIYKENSYQDPTSPLHRKRGSSAEDPASPIDDPISPHSKI